MNLLQKHLNELLETISSYNIQKNNTNSASLSSSSSSSAFLGQKQTTNNLLTCNSLVNASITNTGFLAATIPSVLSTNNNNNQPQTKSPSCSSLCNNKSSTLNNQKATSNQENINQIACKLEDILKTLIQVFMIYLLIFFY
jgi:hypothetical protein